MKIDIKEAADIVDLHLRSGDWTFVQRDASRTDRLTIEAHNQLGSFFRLFISGKPEIFRCQLVESDEGTLLRTSFSFSQPYRLWRRVRMLSLATATAVMCLIVSAGGTNHLSRDVIVLLVTGLYATALLAVATPILAYSCALRQHQVRADLYSAIHDTTGVAHRHMSGGHTGSPPDFSTINATIGILLIGVFPELFDSFAGGRLLEIGMAVCLIATLALGVTVSVRPKVITARGRPSASILLMVSAPILVQSLASILLVESWWDGEISVNGRWLLTFLLLPANILFCYFLVTPVERFLYDASQQRSSSNNPISENAEHGFRLIMICAWVMLAAVNITAAALVCGAIEYSLLGTDDILTFILHDYDVVVSDQLSVRVGLMASIAPWLLFPLALFVRWISTIARVLPSLQSNTRQVARTAVATVCNSTGTAVPYTVVQNDDNVWCHVTSLWPFGNVLVVSTGLMAALAADELEAVMAHEIWHIRQHSGIVGLLTSLSQLALIGKGIMVGALDSSRLEFEADAFSVKYVDRRSKGNGKRVVVKALQKILVVKELARVNNGRRRWWSRGAIVRGGAERGDTVRALVRGTQLLAAAYLGDLAVAYRHPTVVERIARIQSIDVDHS